MIKANSYHLCILGLSGHNLQRPSKELVDAFYQINQNWLEGSLILDYNGTLKRPLIEFYTYNKSNQETKYILELYGNERYISESTADKQINIDQNITTFKVTLSDEQHTTAIDQGNENYGNVKRVSIHSQLTIEPREMDATSK